MKRPALSTCRIPLRAISGLVSLALLLPAPAQAQETAPVQPAPRIDRDLLSGIEDRAPVRSADENPYEYRAYTHLLLEAHRTPQEALTKAARHDLTYAHLWEEPGKYRGEVVHVAGQLRRLRKFDAPASVRAEGVPDVYEGWIFDEVTFANPYCVLVTELPPGLHVGEKLEDRVTFDGYLFKRYRYKAGDGVRDCPLLIGHTLGVVKLPAAPPESGWSFSNAFLPAFLGLLLGTVLLTVGLGWWFRRGDRHVQSLLRRAGPDKFQEPGDGPTSGEATDPPPGFRHDHDVFGSPN